jgi:hypothetical protein
MQNLSDGVFWRADRLSTFWTPPRGVDWLTRSPKQRCAPDHRFPAPGMLLFSWEENLENLGELREILIP